MYILDVSFISYHRRRFRNKFKFSLYFLVRFFLVDGLVTLEIFPIEAVPRYALYNEEGFVRICLFLVPGTKGFGM